MRLELALYSRNEDAWKRLLDANGGNYCGPLFDIPTISGGNRVVQTSNGVDVIGRHPDVVTFVIKDDRAWLVILDWLLAHWPAEVKP